mgnify:CR=1 FL=1
MIDSRKAQLTDWVNEQLRQLLSEPSISVDLTTVSGDASFRRYFRAEIGQQTFIAVDAPPENENSELFVEVAGYLREAGVKSPEVLAKNYDNGFLLLEDFGDCLYLPRLLSLQAGGLDAISEYQVESLYKSAISALIKIQSNVNKERLAPYSREKLHSEMQLFEDWFCGEYLNLELTDGDRELIASTFSFLEDAVLGQIQVAVHRDYHSRNLMLVNGDIGVIDYQDAVLGPMTYDLVSLLRDCYVAWPEQQVTRWALSFHKQAISAGNIPPMNEQSFLRWFDLTGLQRHLKVLGIFSRLNHRDGKSAYLNDLPLVLSYVLTVGARHPETSELVEWLHSAGIPERIGTVAIPA